MAVVSSTKGYVLRPFDSLVAFVTRSHQVTRFDVLSCFAVFHCSLLYSFDSAIVDDLLQSETLEVKN